GDQVFQGPDLLGQLFTRPDHLVGRPHVVDLRALAVFVLDQSLGAVGRAAAIVADDAAATIGVGKPGNDAGLAGLHDLRRIGIEHAVIVGLAILGEGVMYLWIGREPRRLQPRLNHAQAAGRKNRALER